MIPAHLARFAWYAPHLAWLASQGHATAHEPPEGTAPRRAELSDADLRGAYLRGAYLSDADLTGADLRDAYLSDADLTGADLRGAVLRGAYLAGANLAWADLSGACLAGADLSGARLTGANLRSADLEGADLSAVDLCEAGLSGVCLHGASGIIAVGPVGACRRIIYGVAHPAATMVHAGCWWGTLDATRAAVAEHYADGTGREQYRAGYLAALRTIAAVLGRGDAPRRRQQRSLDAMGEIVEYLAEHGPCSVAEIVEHHGWTRRATDRRIGYAVEAGRIVAVPGRPTRWRVA